MPVMIQIRNVPEETHRRLKARAALEGMSIPTRSMSNHPDSGSGEHIARYGQVFPLLTAYFSVYQTASARCDQLTFGWDRKFVLSMTMFG